MRTPAGSATALGVVSVAAVHAAPALCGHSRLACRALGVRDRLDVDRCVALTFDDGPHPSGTPAVLETLDELGVTATFFLVGEQVRRNPGLAREIAAAAMWWACTATVIAICCGSLPCRCTRTC